MKTKQIPRVMIAGTNSGCGKTTITCAILQLLVNNKIKTTAFKCGPDYIDTMFHQKAINVKSTNLDAFFCDDNTLNYLLAKNSSESQLSVIEGVMGYYDGMSLNTTTASTYDVSQITDTPVILCINCAGMSNSSIAILEGFRNFKPKNNIAGVIFNNMSKHTYDMLKLTINHAIKPLGYLPKLPPDLIFESRNLGLVTANEIENIKEKLQKIAKIATDTLDLDGIISLAHSAKDVNYTPMVCKKIVTDIKIGVAYDRAFCFYYHDNLTLLEEMGAQLVYFSPLNDTCLPDVDGIYIGGGYPELYSKQLDSNYSMQASIKSALNKKIPCIAECGGFMYLSQLYGGQCFNTGKLTRFGYVTLTAKHDNMLCQKGEKIRGHEFHYFDSTNNGDAFIAEKTNGKSWDCVVADENLYSGFPHLYFYSNTKCVENFLKKCMQSKQNNCK